MTYIEDGACRLISRKQNQYKSFGPLAAALAKLKVQNAIMDGEVVCLDAKGKSVFLDLMRPRKANAILILLRFAVAKQRGPSEPSIGGAQTQVTAINPNESKPEPIICKPHGEARHRIVPSDMPAGL